MKYQLLLNEKNRSQNFDFVELFGLSRTGKTYFLKQLIQNGNQGFLSEDFSKKKKISFFIKHLLLNPSSTRYLFFKLNSNRIKLPSLQAKHKLKIARMRNSYLASVLAKYESVKKMKSKFFIDEFLVQSLFIILQNPSSKKEIKEILNRLPKTGKILLVEEDSKTRYKRIIQTRFPGQQIHEPYSRKWMENSEFNYKLIREVLLEDYGPIEKNPPL